MQAVRESKAEIGTLKEELRVQNKATYIEQAHTSLDLDCTIGCANRLQEEEIQDLEKELRELDNMTVVEEHAHRAAATQLQKLQADLTKQIKQWGAKLQVDAQEKKRALDVCIRCNVSLCAERLFKQHCISVGACSRLTWDVQDLKAKHKATLIKYKDVEKEHSKETALKNEREMQQQQAQEAEETLQNVERQYAAAATIIQAHFKGFKARQNAKGGKDKGKKGKKKK